LTQGECEREALFQILAGSETTATAIRATVLYIITTPHIYQALKKEIAQGIRDGNISNPIAYDEAKKLPYLQVGQSSLLQDPEIDKVAHNLNRP
jgi:cytochrome P450